jgi:RNA polymerase-binding transcription factor
MLKKTLSKKRNEELKGNLTALKRNILADVRKSIGGKIDVDVRLTFEILKDNADKSVDDLLKHVDAAIIGNKSEMLDKIDEAIEKVKDGTYGVCEGCGCEIPLKRLKIIAFATHCVSCQNENEKRAKEGFGREQNNSNKEDQGSFVYDEE